MSDDRPKVDYSIRPAKAAVRQMVVTALARLGPLMSLDNYRYIGMGSIYFSDFQLVHRQLGITDMLSIEGKLKEERVRFNLPLACIDLQMGNTNDVLPRLALEEKPHIVWLDYESRVAPAILADIVELVGSCAPGSILIITVNADRPRDEREREIWLSALGDYRLETSDPREKGEYALLSYQVIRSQIDDALSDRNAGVPNADQRVRFQQAFHLVYADGVQMLTVGGGLVAETKQQEWDACEIESLEFTRTGEQPCQVKVPYLTRREVHHLLSEMPESQGDIVKAAEEAAIPPEDAREFAAVYRYAPLFVAAEDW